MRRMLVVIVAAWLIGSFTLIAGSMAAGDFATQSLGFGASGARVRHLRTALQLDRPLGERYLAWLNGVTRLDLGHSVLYGRPAGPLVAERARHTVVLAAAAGAIAVCVGLPLGLFTGSRPESRVARAIDGITTICISIPPLLASVLVVWLAALMRWAPVAAAGPDAFSADALLTSTVLPLIVPALALAGPLAATIERIESRAITEALGAPCMIAARARGVPPHQVLWRHAARLGASSLLATSGVLGAALISGSLAVEIVTSWPGLGRLALDALLARDVVLSAACTTVAAVIVGILLVISDVLVRAIDPRLRDEAVAR